MKHVIIGLLAGLLSFAAQAASTVVASYSNDTSGTYVTVTRHERAGGLPDVYSYMYVQQGWSVQDWQAEGFFNLRDARLSIGHPEEYDSPFYWNLEGGSDRNHTTGSTSWDVSPDDWLVLKFDTYAPPQEGGYLSKDIAYSFIYEGKVVSGTTGTSIPGIPVPIPEPSVALLAGLSSVLALRRRR